VAVVGISPDKPSAQKKFAEDNSLGFPLLSDPDHKVAESYGVWGEKTMYDRKVQGIIRSSFLIDEKGKITAVWYKIKPEATVLEALKVLEA
jgi:peroxiredoxin Q/BCP